MLRKFFIIVMALLFISVSTQAQAADNIEIFHINKGKVINKVPMNEAIQNDIELMLHGINDIFRGFEPIPKKGQMVKIPLEPAIRMENEWLMAFVNEVILIFPEYENPHLMVFNDENNPVFFTFEASVDDIIDKLKLELKGMKQR